MKVEYSCLRGVESSRVQGGGLLCWWSRIELSLVET